MNNDEKKLDVLIRLILKELETAGFSNSTITSYQIAFKRLKKLAKKQGMNHPTDKLLTTFLKDDRYAEKKFYCESRAKLHRQCVRILESYMKSGCINWSVQKREDVAISLKSPILRQKLTAFINQMKEDALRPNTICGYKRIVSYFLIYCQSKGYQDLSELKVNDVTNFIKEQYVYHFKPTTICAVLPGLKKFLSTDENGSKFVIELSVHLPRKRNIIEIYDDNQISAMKTHITSGGETKRDTAICMLALETGLRAVDICNLKLHDLDWHKDCIHITQEKTGEIFNMPLRSSYGNAIADYILDERPDCNSEYLFVRAIAPFQKLEGHSSIWYIINRMEKRSGAKDEKKISGTRMTRHNTASHMLTAGIPMPDISAALGHRNPDSVSIYLTTDDENLASCTLPMPVVQKRGAV